MRSAISLGLFTLLLLAGCASDDRRAHRDDDYRDRDRTADRDRHTARDDQRGRDHSNRADRDRDDRPAQAGHESRTTRAGVEEDQAFVNAAASGGEMEVELGRIAAQRASNPRVRQFGQRMVDDHTRANRELRVAARAVDLSVPTTMNAHHEEIVDRLRDLSGSDFDRAYMRHMIEDHEADIRAFESQSERHTLGELKDFAVSTLPVLREHLRMARDIARDIGVEVR